MLTARQKAILSHIFDSQMYDLFIEIVNCSLKKRSEIACEHVEDHVAVDFVLMGVAEYARSLKDREVLSNTCESSSSLTDEYYFKLWIEMGSVGIPDAVAEKYLSDNYIGVEYATYLKRIGL